VAQQRSRPVYHARSHGGFAPDGADSFGPRGGGSPWDGDGDEWTGDTDPGAGDDPYGSPDGRDGLSSGGNSKTGDPYGSADGRDALLPGGKSKTGDPYGSPDRRDAFSSGSKSKSEDPYGETSGNFADGPHGDPRLAERNRRDSDVPGVPGGTQSKGPSREGATPGKPGGSGGGQHSSERPESNSPNGAPHATDSQSVSAPHGTPKAKPQSMATTRGSDWGLPASAGRSVAATRPIRVLCYPDRLVIVPETQGQRPREIPLQAQTGDSMDELVSAVWEHMKSWGKAGNKLYWRPLLSIDIQPGGQARYAEIEALLTDSGIDVQRRQPRAAPRQDSRPAMRQPFRQ
jgi:hypothetical protein